MSRPATPMWFAAHELRLAWRDWRDMMTAGGKRSLFRAFLLLILVAALFHLPVWGLVEALGLANVAVNAETLTATGIVLLLFCSLLLAQALESVTRSLYTRGDLDLIVSSPVDLTRLQIVRLVVNAVPIAILAMVLASPLVNVLALTGGAHWLGGYLVALAFGILAAALGILVTIGLFRLLGPRKTRLVAQVVAAVVGAAFAIGIQVMAIVYYGTLAGGAALVSEGLAGVLPAPSSVIWLPARAALGDGMATVVFLVGSLGVMAAVVALVAPRLSVHALAATDGAVDRQRAAQGRRRGVAGSPSRALRRKEWLLLRRDPWLISQTLTQLLYLIPPALLLMSGIGGGVASASVVIVMVMVAVAGQLAGALAWLAVSGEDAPELVATAPVGTAAVTRAKVEAVMGATGLALLPLAAVFAMVSPFHAAVALAGAALSGLSTIRIQLWFRIQARRSNFRRRHTSSRLATFAEAMVSFSWAAAAGLAAAQSWFAIASAGIALLILAGTRALAPRG